MVLQILDPPRDLCVADREPEPPAGHAVRLRHREELEADLPRAVDGEEALRRTPVEDEIAVREVVHHPRAGALCPLDRLLEDTVRNARRERVGRVVQIERSRARRRGVPVRSRVGAERKQLEFCVRERDGGAVVGIARVGEHDRVALLDARLRELHQPGFRAGQDRDLGRRIDLDAVQVAVARCDRLLQRRQPCEGRVAVRVRPPRRAVERLRDMRRRPDVGIAAPEVDQRLAVARRRGGDPREERGEVLLGQAHEPPRHVLSHN